ncbi:hypothetical protein L2E82_37273 [Cichorium intybus]|uniref:Uncharacterized protein n=1 Tax=Cichorium intybus TaxID=13427 RepID=A0ACB9AEK1_CICIN|nr:hypothetical protein L2E82_37273 [Cichorium intybus]
MGEMFGMEEHVKSSNEVEEEEKEKEESLNSEDEDDFASSEDLESEQFSDEEVEGSNSVSRIQESNSHALKKSATQETETAKNNENFENNDEENKCIDWENVNTKVSEQEKEGSGSCSPI